MKLQGELVEELYLLQGTSDRAEGLIVTSTAKHTDVNTWHCRLGHPSEGKLSSMLKGELYDGGVPHNSSGDVKPCENCIYAKHHVTQFPKQASTRAQKKL